MMQLIQEFFVEYDRLLSKIKERIETTRENISPGLIKQVADKMEIKNEILKDLIISRIMIDL